MQRQSIKRQAILDCIKESKAHPTAEQIYNELKPAFPDLSLATVYRNINQLEESGLVRHVGTVLGRERYDADVSVHSHAVCVKCGRMIDVRDIELPIDLIERAQKDTGFSILCSDLQFSGICNDCMKEGCDDGK